MLTATERSMDHVVLYKKHGVYACFPDLAFSPEGALMVRFATRTRASHVDQTGGYATMTSTDGGDTWQETDEPFIDRKWLTSDGRLVSASSDGWIEAPASSRDALTEEGKLIRDARDGVIAYLGGISSLTSTDGGRTWQRRPIPLPPTFAGTMSYHRSASELVTRDGTRIVVHYGSRYHGPDRGHAPHEPIVIRSTDDGVTWQCEAMFPQGLPDGYVGLNEPAVQQLSDGRIIAMIRSNPDGSVLYRSESVDDGLTWSDPVATSITGYPAQLVNLPGGGLLCTYGYRRPPMGIRASISVNHGHSWDAVPEVVLRSDGHGQGSDLGYPVSLVLENGDVLTVYYITTDDAVTHVAATRWRVPGGCGYSPDDH